MLINCFKNIFFSYCDFLKSSKKCRFMVTNSNNVIYIIIEYALK